MSVLTDMDAPKGMGISLSDHLTGMMAAYGILGAICAREKTGRGQLVETSLLQATLAFQGENAARYFEDGNIPSRRTAPARRRSTPSSPATETVRHSPVFARQVLAGAVPRRRARRLGRGWADLPDVRPTDGRITMRWRPSCRSSRRSRATTGSSFCWKQTPSSPIYSLDETLADPQVQHLDMVREVPHPKLGTVKLDRWR